MNLIERARAFATERHAGQTRKGAAQEPYITHPQAVAELVAGWGGTPEWIAAAWLHDTVEDCPPTNLEELQTLFGAEVSMIVAELTDDKSLPKPERKAQQVRNAGKKTPGAALIKIADKTCNVRTLRLSAPAHWTVQRSQAYLDWACEVVEALPHQPPQALSAFREELRKTQDWLT